MRFILSITAIVAVGAGILSGCKSASTPTPVDTTKTNTVNTTNANSVPKANSPKPVDTAERITLADAKKDFDAGKATFLDTRDEVSFKQEHVKGSLNVPMNKLVEKFGQIPKDKKIIAYCS